jgi:hypothetical protein
MSTPYTYLIGWSKTNTFYYGSQYGQFADPKNLWTTYFTSSKYVADYYRQYGDPDIIEIRKTFKTPDQCKFWEHRVVKHYIKDYRFLNISSNFGDKAICTAGMVLVTRDGIYNFLIPVTHPDYLNGKVKHISVGKTIVQDKSGKRFKVSISDPRFLSGEFVSINKGKPTPNHFGKIWVTNKVTNKLILPSELGSHLTLGYTCGKTQKYPNRNYAEYTRIKL